MRRNRIQSLWRAAMVTCIPCMVTLAQTTPAAQQDLPFGTDGYDIPPGIQVPATSKRVVELLGQALAAKPAVSRRVEIVRDLGECQLPAVLPIVIEAMSDPSAAVRAQAAWAVGMVGESSSLDALRALSKDSDAQVRIQTVRSGWMLKDMSFVTSGLNDESEMCFVAACPVASTTEHDAIIAKRLPDLSASGKVVAVKTLGHRGAVDYAELVAKQIQSPDIALVISSIDALAQLKSTSQAAIVKPLLSHEHPSVRRAALRAMASLVAADEQTSIARQMLGDDDLSVREAACGILQLHVSPEAVPAIFQQLSAGYNPLRMAARDALVASASVSPQAVLVPAAALLRDADRDRRVDGSYILGQIKSDAEFDQHVKLLTDPDWIVVQQAVESLGNIGRRDAAGEIAKIASRAGQTDQMQARAPNELQAIGSAFIACGKLDDKSILPLARQLVPQKLSCPVVVRARAIWAAGVLADPDDAELAGMFRSIASDNSPYESEEARFEAIKALGNQHNLTSLEEMQRQAREQSAASLRWMAHLTVDRLSNAATPSAYTPPTVQHIAETSIQDLK